MITRPKPEEYNPYYAKYVGMVPDDSPLLVLNRLKESSYRLFNELSDDKAHFAYADGKWTVKEVLGHIIDAERTFGYRLFSFSRDYAELPSFDQNVYVSNGNFNSRTIQNLASEFRTTRESNIYLIESLTDEQLDRKGVASGNEVTVRALIYMLIGHELHHLSVLNERYFS
ncbi:MAG: DinB family protein [Cyanobacteria bacterium SZAS LIN-5]|nr:DinB family protein [Cyanobacteria bacterium SZAS LIN-5]RTL45274.1 MAG: DinB family protein [Candidatus Melainabacteria bacterium]